MPKLLIVDDEADVREFAKRFFTKRSIDVTTASGRERGAGDYRTGEAGPRFARRAHGGDDRGRGPQRTARQAG